MENGRQQPPGRAAPKKKTSTVTFVRAILDGFVLLVPIGVGVAIYAVMSSTQGRAVVGMLGDGMKVMAKAQKAPGTKELRAAGCKQAMVMDTADMARLTKWMDASSPAENGPDSFGEIATCSASPAALTCDRVASTYVGVVGPRPKSFLITAQPTASTPACANLYEGRRSRRCLQNDELHNEKTRPGPGLFVHLRRVAIRSAASSARCASACCHSCASSRCT